MTLSYGSSMGPSLERCLTGREVNGSSYPGWQSHGYKPIVAWKPILAPH
jgi:hypothetical protein